MFVADVRVVRSEVVKQCVQLKNGGIEASGFIWLEIHGEQHLNCRILIVTAPAPLKRVV